MGCTLGFVSVQRLLLRLAVATLLLGAVYLLLGQLVPGAWARLRRIDPGWIVVAVALEVMSLTGYAALFHAGFSRDPVLLRPSRSAPVAVGELGGVAPPPPPARGAALLLLSP